MLDVVFASVRSVAESWRQEVSRRRQFSRTDPVADALDYAASELTGEIERLERDLHYLSPEQYAELKGVSSQTIRNWINAGELEAVRDGRGRWLIPATAERKRKEEMA